LFRLETDGSPSVAEIQRVRRAFATEIEAIRKMAAKPFTFAPVAPPKTTHRSCDHHI
jgi:hypothetical protein